MRTECPLLPGVSYIFTVDQTWPLVQRKPGMFLLYCVCIVSCSIKIFSFSFCCLVQSMVNCEMQW